MQTANQLRFLVVRKCSAKATKQLCCWSFDNVLMQSWMRNIELCCSCSYTDIGHFVSFSHCFHCSLHCWFTPTRSFCVSFVLVNHLHSSQKSMPMRHFICKRHCIILLCNNNCTLDISPSPFISYILLSLIESFVSNRNDLYGQKEPGQRNRLPLPGSICPYCMCCVTSAAWLHKRYCVRPYWSAVVYSQ